MLQTTTWCQHPKRLFKKERKKNGRLFSLLLYRKENVASYIAACLLYMVFPSWSRLSEGKSITATSLSAIIRNCLNTSGLWFRLHRGENDAEMLSMSLKRSSSYSLTIEFVLHKRLSVKLIDGRRSKWISWIVWWFSRGSREKTMAMTASVKRAWLNNQNCSVSTISTPRSWTSSIDRSDFLYSNQPQLRGTNNSPRYGSNTLGRQPSPGRLEVSDGGSHSVKVRTADSGPHLVSLGSGRLSTNITLIHLPEGIIA